MLNDKKSCDRIYVVLTLIYSINIVGGFGMERKSTVYISKEDKEMLKKHCEKIEEILEKYPYSNDSSDNFITTMSRLKTTFKETKQCVNLIKVKD